MFFHTRRLSLNPICLAYVCHFQEIGTFLGLIDGLPWLTTRLFLLAGRFPLLPRILQERSECSLEEPRRFPSRDQYLSPDSGKHSPSRRPQWRSNFFAAEYSDTDICNRAASALETGSDTFPLSKVHVIHYILSIRITHARCKESGTHPRLR